MKHISRVATGTTTAKAAVHISKEQVITHSSTVCSIPTMLDKAAVSIYGKLKVRPHLHPAASLGTELATSMVVLMGLVVVMGEVVLSMPVTPLCMAPVRRHVFAVIEASAVQIMQAQ
jgi:hypothetical protein